MAIKWLAMALRVHNFDLSTLEYNAALQPMVTGGSVVSSAHVLDIPSVQNVIGTVKILNAWCLLFISKNDWVCSIGLRSGSIDTLQKHFLVPSAWKSKTWQGIFIAKVLRNQDIVFAYDDGVAVVRMSWILRILLRLIHCKRGIG